MTQGQPQSPIEQICWIWDETPVGCWDYHPAYGRECHREVELAANDLDTTCKQMSAVVTTVCLIQLKSGLLNRLSMVLEYLVSSFPTVLAWQRPTVKLQISCISLGCFLIIETAEFIGTCLASLEFSRLLCLPRWTVLNSLSQLWKLSPSLRISI